MINKNPYWRFLLFIIAFSFLLQEREKSKIWKTFKQGERQSKIKISNQKKTFFFFVLSNKTNIKNRKKEKEKKKNRWKKKQMWVRRKKKKRIERRCDEGNGREWRRWKIWFFVVVVVAVVETIFVCCFLIKIQWKTINNNILSYLFGHFYSNNLQKINKKKKKLFSFYKN